jgi:Domain of unknown function (DUF4214)
MASFIETLYQNILDRDPENQAVIEGWVNTANSVGIAETTSRFFFSPEFISKKVTNKVFVDKLYRCILGREADDQGKQHYLDLYNGGNTRDIVNDFINSAEYRQNVEDNITPHPFSQDLTLNL